MRSATPRQNNRKGRGIVPTSKGVDRDCKIPPINPSHGHFAEKAEGAQFTGSIATLPVNYPHYKISHPKPLKDLFVLNAGYQDIPHWL